MAKKKATKKTPVTSTPPKAPASPAPKASRRAKPAAGLLEGLFAGAESLEQTRAEKALASAVKSAGGTAKLLEILQHVEQAGGAASVLQAVELYERMNRVLAPPKDEQPQLEF